MKLSSFFDVLEVMKQIGTFQILAIAIYELEAYFPFIMKLNFSDARFEKVLKWTPQKL